jgi:hypothetical protein
MPVNRTALRKDLQAQVKMLEKDLIDRAHDVDEFHDDLYGEWENASKSRVSAGYEEWLAGQVTQTAVAWVLATVFLRFCEDNELLAEPWLSGPGERLEKAEDRQHAFFAEDPQRTSREWMTEAFDHMAAANRVVAGLFDKGHNPLWRITPSPKAAHEMVSFWRVPGEHNGIAHDFSDPELDTRFLGDLYEELSEHAQKTYALLQTPDFVEEFILDRTLEPAIREFGIDPPYPATEWNSREDLPNGLRVIDPTCGSGHFLLGAFKRLLREWEKKSSLHRQEQIHRALYGVHGVDKNPFAVAIARFRLMIEALKADKVRPFHDPLFPNWQINIAVGDSLLHGRERHTDEEGMLETFREDPIYTFKSEDVHEYIQSVDILGPGTYHCVVGNPPYITVKDRIENHQYKKRYSSCYQKYSLSVPFAERFFKLAVRQLHGLRGSGFTGQITANSFMKREFGKKLIEEFFGVPEGKREHQAVNLTEVIDTSGAYIPGHGTPTVIIIGRNAFPSQSRPVRVVLGIEAEPQIPNDPSSGLVWNSIVDLIDSPGSESRWVSAADLDRSVFAFHPWSLSGGGANEVLDTLSDSSPRVLSQLPAAAGITSVTGEDDVYLLPDNGAARRLSILLSKKVVVGDSVRDFSTRYNYDSVWVYDQHFHPIDLKDLGSTARYLSNYAALISRRHRFGVPMIERGLRWYEWQELYSSKLRTPLLIAFAEVATHNHFVFDRGGRIFKQTSPVIKLQEGASEEDYLGLLGVLNSSVVCFWLRNNCFPKGGSGMGRGIQPEAWMGRYAFNSTNIEKIPLPYRLLPDHGRVLDDLAQDLSSTEPSAVCAAAPPTTARLKQAEADNASIRRKMIAIQEELDWQVYADYGLLSKSEAAVLLSNNFTAVPEIELGQRAFEIVMSRQIDAGELDTQWFARHRSKRTSEIPEHWPGWYKALVKRRIDKITSDRKIALIERPECKRRWRHDQWKIRQRDAVRNYLLDLCEDRPLWYVPGPGGSQIAQPRTVFSLADELRRRPEAVEAARIYTGEDRPDMESVLAEILEDEHVPFLSAYRYKQSGIDNYKLWEQTWRDQRTEDEQNIRLDIDVPPKYKSSDFQKASYWKQRGKLDVPKERFISYPDASPDHDPSRLLGWAGWDHKDRAAALTWLIEERRTKNAWQADRLKPLLQGLLELEFWLEQWHSEPDPDFRGDSAASVFKKVIDGQARRLRIDVTELEVTEPLKEKSRRGRASGRQ